MLVIEEVSLINIARDFDAQFRKLSTLIHDTGSIEELQADKQVADHLLNGAVESCSMISCHLDNIEQVQASLPSARHLLASLKRMVGLERCSPSHSMMGSSIGGTPRFGTPSSISRPGKKPTITTPSKYKNKRKGIFNYYFLEEKLSLMIIRRHRH